MKVTYSYYDDDYQPVKSKKKKVSKKPPYPLNDNLNTDALEFFPSEPALIRHNNDCSVGKLGIREDMEELDEDPMFGFF